MFEQAQELERISTHLQWLQIHIKQENHVSEEEQRAAGITHYIWRTQGDGRVRAAHAANNGMLFAWDHPPATGHPGKDYGCRCWAEPVQNREINDPPIEPVYPELLLLPFLRIGRLLNAWRAWAHRRRVNSQWKLGGHKSQAKWANRIEKGKWTPDDITEKIRRGEPHPAPNNVNPGNGATRYQLGNRFIVRDNVTKEILQLGAPGYVPKTIP